MPVVLNTKMDVQSDKLAIEDSHQFYTEHPTTFTSSQHLRWLTCSCEIFLSLALATKLETEVPLFSEVPAFPSNTKQDKPSIASMPNKFSLFDRTPDL